MEPAPIPSGIAQMQNHRKFCEQENPSSAAAVSPVEMAVTFAVPRFAIIFVLKRLETTVPPEMTAETKLAYETGTWNSP